ncbi:MAG: SDR family NAD(P)-dependent oxidoreductase, partial [Candidatus Koribacter versatilis]|nr:SDR family NAD(P)-dependent oxidoreductase [Candidatus Koribacter versatilis]
MKSASQPALAGQVAVITGAGRGIGAAIAATLASLGARVVLCGRTREALAGTSAAIHNQGGQTAVMECDVTDLRSVESLAERVERTFGRVDILVNNAGIGAHGGPLHQLSPDAWDRVLNTNLR